MSKKNIVTIGTSTLTPKTCNGQKVVNFNDIDVLHQRVVGTAKRNFNENKNYFTVEEDYFLVTRENCSNYEAYIYDIDSMYEFRTLNIPPKGLTLITESGYLLLVKSFTDELSWKVQKILVKTYFRAKHEPQQNPESLIIPAPKFDLTISFRSYRGKPCVNVAEAARVFNVAPMTIRSIIRDGLERDTECQLLYGSEVREFHKENNMRIPGARLYIIYKEGFKKLKAIFEGREAIYIIARRGAAQLKTKLIAAETNKTDSATEVNRQFELQTQTVKEANELIEAPKPGLADTILSRINLLNEKLDKILISTGGATQ